MKDKIHIRDQKFDSLKDISIETMKIFIDEAISKGATHLQMYDRLETSFSAYRYETQNEINTKRLKEVETQIKLLQEEKNLLKQTI